MESEAQEPVIRSIMPLFLHLLNNNQCLEFFLTKYTSNPHLLTYHYIFLEIQLFKSNLQKRFSEVTRKNKTCGSNTLQCCFAMLQGVRLQ